MRKLSTKPNTDAPDTDYPFGKIRDRNGATDGTGVNENAYGDMHQFFEKLMDEAGVIANGFPDNDYSGFQLFEALDKLINNTEGWVAYDSFASYMRKGRTCFLFGRAGSFGTSMSSAGTGGFTLPLGYRPTTQQVIKGVLLFDTGVDATTGNLTINTDGTVWHTGLTGAGVARWITLTGITFPLD